METAQKRNDGLDLHFRSNGYKLKKRHLDQIKTTEAVPKNGTAVNANELMTD